ncbi:MAG: hypothetical protein V1784_12695 [bacterium]
MRTHHTALLWAALCVMMLVAASVRTQGIMIDHTCTDIAMVPPNFIDSAKAHFNMTYGHTSHGSQIISGMQVLMNHDSLYDFFNDHDYYRFGPPNPVAPPGDLSLWDYVPDGDLGNPDRVTWAARTRTMLTNGEGEYAIYPHSRNIVLWSWCGQVSWATPADIDTYLTLMSQLEADFDSVTFVYMTGHLDGTGESGSLHQRNEQIRQYCRDNNKVLFDFADIESYDPDGNYYLPLGANDNCDYSGGNWAVQWCAAHPGDTLCEYCDCAHSQPLNCNLKARAFWWMMARLAGWGVIPMNLVARTSGANLILLWKSVPSATSYKIYSSAGAHTGFAEDLTGSFSDTTWTAPFPTDTRFYRVTALTG